MSVEEVKEAVSVPSDSAVSVFPLPWEDNGIIGVAVFPWDRRAHHITGKHPTHLHCKRLNQYGWPLYHRPVVTKTQEPDTIDSLKKIYCM